MTASRQARSCIKLLPGPAAQFQLHFGAGQALREESAHGYAVCAPFSGHIPDHGGPEGGNQDIHLRKFQRKVGGSGWCNHTEKVAAAKVSSKKKSLLPQRQV